jgi:RNA polymerase sigma-70 factor (ECF subfamily)
MDKNTPRLDPLTWLDRYGDYLYYYAFSRLRSVEAAEDVVQETLMAALKSSDTFAGNSSEKSWLTGILKHKIMDHLRKVFREKSFNEAEILSGDLDTGFTGSGKWKGHWDIEQGPVDWGKDPARLLEQKEFMEVLEMCLEKLPPHFAGVFILYQIEKIPTQEICKELEITPTNVWVILHRCRRQLRRCLEVNWIREKKPARGLRRK